MRSGRRTSVHFAPPPARSMSELRERGPSPLAGIIAARGNPILLHGKLMQDNQVVFEELAKLHLSSTVEEYHGALRVIASAVARMSSACEYLLGEDEATTEAR